MLGAENQQERLVKSGWIIGFVEGEGCFSVSFVKQPKRDERRGYNTGIQVGYEFAITQGESSFSALKEIQKFFGVIGIEMAGCRTLSNRETKKPVWMEERYLMLLSKNEISTRKIGSFLVSSCPER